MNNKTLIIGDCHIGKGLSIGINHSSSSVNSRIIDQFSILDWILTEGVSRSVNRFVFTGDIFEELKPDHNMVVMFISWLKEVSSNGIEIHIVAGNHDLKRVGNKYSSVLDIIDHADIDGCYIHNSIHTLNTDGADFTFVPFRDRRSLQSQNCEDAMNKLFNLLSYECIHGGLNKKIMIGHLAIEKSFYTDEFDDVSNELMIPVSYFDGWDYVWMGHVHSPQIMNKSKPLVEHVGSMDLSDFGETKHVKNLILYDALSDRIERVEVPSRPLRRLKVEIDKGNDPTDYLINEIFMMDEDYPFKDSIVKIEAKILDPESSSIDRDKVLAVLNELNISHVCSFSESKNITVVPANKMHIQDNAIKPKEAVKLIAEIIEHKTEDDKDNFITVCNEIIEEAELS